MLIIDKIIAIWQSITFGTKFVLISSILCCILDILNNNLLFNILVDIPNLTIYQYELWRLLIPQFFHGNIYNLSISLLGFLVCAIEVEKNYGTIPFFCDIFFKNLIIQIIYVFLCFSLSYLTLDVQGTQSFGFWNITFIYMLNKGLADQDDYQKFLCFPLYFPSKYYPPAFFLIMNSIEYPRLDLIAATLFAFIEYQLFDGFMMKLSKGFVTKIEQSFPFKYIQSRQDFITCDQINHSFVMDDAKMAEYQLEIGMISTTESKIQDQNQI
ncbi:unnamed protein product [Paramecium primaurelia]|uniref:Peptidase S54 rhomboid domain-containing protein n=1 Tax=Paramecium primaurelia TaxID=5886 RepID=A0A8S1LT13_PARPR|nr:unnamed protein product [Paramecium primaurelia]